MRRANFLLSSRGFTLIELLVVMTLFAALSSFATISLLKPQTKAAVDTTVTTLLTDFREQQLKAMIGDSQGSSASQQYGIYFTSTGYTLFRGTSYSADEPSNFVVNLQAPIFLTNISFPANQLVFAKISGEVVDFVDGASSVTVYNSAGGESKTITVNRYGVISLD